MLDPLLQQSLQSQVSFATGVPAGLAAARFAKALHFGNGEATAACAYAGGQGHWRNTPQVFGALQKAAVDLTSFADAMLPQPLSSDFLAAVRPMTLIDRVPGWHRVPLNVSILSITGSATARFVGPGLSKPVSKFSMERISLLPHKVVALSVVTIELLRSSSPSAELTLGAELARALAQATDLAFVNPDQGPTADEPGSIAHGATTISSSGSSLSAISTDLASMLALMSANDEALSRAIWIMSSTTATSLAQLRGSGGAPAYPNIHARGGELLGLPVYTTGAARASGSPGESAILLVDPDGILVGDPSAVSIQVSTQATLQIDDAPAAGAQTQISLWQSNLASILCERFVGFERGRDDAVVVLEGVVY